MGYPTSHCNPKWSLTRRVNASTDKLFGIVRLIRRSTYSLQDAMGLGMQCIRCAHIKSLRLCQFPRKMISTSACRRVPPVTEVNNDTCVSEKIEKIMPTPPEYVLEASDTETADILKGNIAVYQDFVTEEEENSLFDEVEPHLKRLRYEKDHWDDVRTSLTVCVTVLVLLHVRRYSMLC